MLAGVCPVRADQEDFYVQAINTENRAKAESVKDRLKGFKNVHIDRQGDRFIVRIGPIHEGKKAVHIRNIIKKKYADAFIRTAVSNPDRRNVDDPSALAQPKSAVSVAVAQTEPSPVSEPKSTIPTAVMKASSAAAPDASPKNRIGQPRFAGARQVQADHKGYFVQAISTENRARAESVRKTLNRFPNVHIDQRENRFIVGIGPIKDGKKAIMVRNIVRKTYPDAFIKMADSNTVGAGAAPTASVVAQPAEAKKKATNAPAAKPKQTAPAAVPESKSTVPVKVAQAAPTAAPDGLTDKRRSQPSATAPDAIAPADTIPSPDLLLKTALDHYHARRYEEALQQLTLFLSLYPTDNNAPSTMFSVAGIQIALKQPLSALRIYSHIIEHYPNTPEAVESVIALADMGIASPGLKPRATITGAQWYLDPVSAYDMVLSKKPPSDIAERLLFQRIAALRLKSRYREAYDAGNQFLERYPQTKHLYPLMAGLRSDAERLIEERIAAGDDLTVVSIMTNARQKGVITNKDTDILIKSAGSYSRLGMTDEARLFLNASRPFAAGSAGKIDTALQELAQTERSSAAPSPIVERWALYEKGRQEIKSSNLSAAKQTFAEVRGADQDEFWSKLTDFTLHDGIWTAKYKDYLKK